VSGEKQDTTIPIDLDPANILASMQEISREMKNLASVVEESLGRKSPEAMKKLEDAAEKGTGRIQGFFRNLGTRVKEDLKSAFDATGVLAGAKLATELGQGIKQVFEMERAFDRLNTRLGLSGKELSNFKRELGKNIAGTGQKLEDILPGVETAAAKGGIRDPRALSSIGESLGKVRASTGEDTAHLSDTVIEILKKQGLAVNGKNFNSTLDALQGTRVNGAFHTAGEAGQSIEGIAGYAKKLGLDTRQLGGLSAMASKSGSSGEEILRQIMDKGTTIGGQQQLNAVFGAQLFKHGKMDAGAFSKIDTGRFGNSAVMEQASGITGANGEDLKRFVQSFKEGTDSFNKVVSGSNETATQFDSATDNLASSVDKFKEETKESAREIGGALSKLGKDAIKGSFGKLGSDAADAAKSLWDNKGHVAGALGVSLGAGLLLGGGLNGLLKKVPGGKLAGGLAGGALAKESGATPVYVVNAGDFGGGSGGMIGAGGLGGKMGGALKGGLQIAAAGAIGAAIGEALLSIPAFASALDSGAKWADKAIGGNQSSDDIQNDGKANMESARRNYNKNQDSAHQLSPSEYAALIENAMVRAHERNRAKTPTQVTNPSAVHGRGGSS
jgi:ABC-type transporter Mla subunit MlaD